MRLAPMTDLAAMHQQRWQRHSRPPRHEWLLEGQSAADAQRLRMLGNIAMPQVVWHALQHILHQVRKAEDVQDKERV